MAKKTPVKPKYYEVRRDNLPPFGSISLPPVDRVSGLMIQDIERIEGIHKAPETDEDGNKPKSYDMLKALAFQCAEFIREGKGEWSFEYPELDEETGEVETKKLEINDFMNWKREPDKERPNFIMWLGLGWRIYQRDIFDPNYKPGN